MNNNQDSRLIMYQAVADYLLKNSSITTPLPNFATLFVLLQQNIARILLILKEQNSDRSGISVNKRAQRADLEMRTLNLSGKMVAYATNENNMELLPLIRISKSDVQTCADNALVTHAVKLCYTAEPLLPNLGTYMVVADEISDLRDLCTTFLVKMPQPRESRRDLKQTTKALNSLMMDTNGVLVKIDAIMLIVRFTQSAFYDHYKNSRSVIRIGSRSLALKGTITDAVTGLGLAGVTISIVPGNGSALKSASGAELGKNVKISAAKGGFNVKTLADGTYTITATKEGYAPQSYTAYVNNGELTIVNIALQPL